VEVWIHVFLTLKLDGGDWPTSRPGRFNHRERYPGILWIGSWVDQGQVWSWWRRDNYLLLLGGKKRKVVQPVA